MSAGDEVISDEFPDATGVVLTRDHFDESLVQVRWETDSGRTFDWWCLEESLQRLN